MTEDTFRVSGRALGPMGPLTASHLFGAICWALRDLEGEGVLKEMLGRFQAGIPPLRLSEPGPFLGRDRRVYLFPAPVAFLAGRARGSEEGIRALHRHRRSNRLSGETRWISEGIFLRIAQGELDLETLREETAFVDSDGVREAPGPYVLRLGMLLSREEFHDLPRAALFPRRVQARARVGRGAAQPFVTSGAEGPWTGIHFFCRMEPAFRGSLESALALSASRGIGRARSIGWGRFDRFQFDAATLPREKPGGLWMTLARAVLSPGEAQALSRSTRSSYSLVRLEGRLGESAFGTSEVAKAPVWMIESGAVTEVPLVGTCPVVFRSGEDEVLQYGFAFPIPVTGNWLVPRLETG